MAKPIFLIGSFGSGIKSLRATLSRRADVITSKSTAFVSGGLALDNMSTQDIIDTINSHKKLWEDNVWFQVKGDKFVGIVSQLLEAFPTNSIFIFTRRNIDAAIDNYRSDIPVEKSTIENQIAVIEEVVRSFNGEWVEVDTRGSYVPFDDNFNPIPAAAEYAGNPRNTFVSILRT